MKHNIKEQLELHEGLKFKPYEDSVGKLTIGIGRNLEDKGISKDEAYHLLDNDLQEIREKLKHHGWYNKLSYIRKKVIIDMAFNMGYFGLLGFEKMIQAIKDDEYHEASQEMLDSKWAEQVGKRADRLAIMMESNEDYD